MGDIQLENQYVWLLVKTGDSIPCKKDRKDWTTKEINKEIGASFKQGYIVEARDSYNFGRLEKDFKRFIIIRTLRENWNEEWLSSTYNGDGTLRALRRFRIPLDKILKVSDINTLKNESRDYKLQIRNKSPLNKDFLIIDDLSTIITSNDYFDVDTRLPKIEEIVTHGSSGTFTINSGGGGDYVSLSAWQSAEAADLTGTGPCIAQIEDAHHYTQSNFQLYGWVTTASDYIRIETVGAARHSGAWDETKFYWSATDTYGIWILEDYVKFDGIQIETLNPTGNSKSAIQINLINPTNNLIEISNCIVRHNADATYTSACISSSDEADSIVNIWNCVLFNIPTSSNRIGITTGGSTMNVYNCTIDGGQVGIYRTGTNPTIVKNCIFSGNPTYACYGTFASGTDYNSTTNGTMQYTVTGGGNTHDRLSQTFSFADSANGDFTLQGDDTGALNYGVSDPGSGLFDDDITGTTRSGQWDIGAFEAAYVDTEGPTINTLTPTDNSTGLSIDTNLSIEFNEVVVAGTSSIHIKLLSDHSTFETIAADSGQVTGTGTNTVTINPSSNLDYETDYYVNIDVGAFEDESSNLFAGLYDTTSSWNFTTFTQNPNISTLSPANNSENAAIDTNLVITFDRIINVVSGNIYIKLYSNDSTIETIDITSGQVTGDGTTALTINPSVTLTNNEDYYVQIDSNALQDNFSNNYSGIADKTTWVFNTISLPPTAVINVLPSTTVEVGEEVYFEGVDSTDDEPIKNAYGVSFSVLPLYEWDFDDGYVVEYPNTGLAVSHFFMTPGTYDVVLTLTDIDGNTDTDTVQITVTGESIMSDFEIRRANFNARISQYLDIQIPAAYRSNTNKLNVTVSDSTAGYSVTLFDSDNLSAEERVILNNYTLPAGNYVLQAQLRDSGDNPISNGTIREKFSKSFDGIPTVGIDKYNNILVNGEYFFVVTPFLEIPERFSDWDARANVQYGLQGYSFDLRNLSEWTQWLDACEAAGYRGLGPERWIGKGDVNYFRNGDVSTIKSFVAATKDHAGLFGWAWADEPNLGGTTGQIPSVVSKAWGYLTHSLDDNHPLITNQYGHTYLSSSVGSDPAYDYSLNASTFGKKTNIFDINGIDNYPVEFYNHASYSDPTRGSMDLHFESIETFRTLYYDATPLWDFVETTDIFTDVEYPNGGPGITAAEITMLCWGDIVHGVKGINWFPLFTEEPTANVTACEEFYSKVQELKNVLYGGITDRTVTSSSTTRGDRVDVLIKETATDIYVIAVRVTEIQEEWVETAEPVSINTDITVGDLTGSINVVVQDESRSVTATDGVFNDDFDRNAVHIYQITKDSVDVTGTPLLLTPTDASSTSDTTPTFTWDSTSSVLADFYEIQIAKNTTFTDGYIEENNVLVENYTPTLELIPDTYYWRVRAYGNHAFSNWSSYNTLTVISDTAPDAPTLLTPSDLSTTSDTTPTFTWSSVVGADSYDIQIATDTGFSSLVEDTTGVGTTSFTASTLPLDTYYWRVRTYGTNTLYSSWSSYYTLTVDSVPDTPVITDPYDNSTISDTTPTFAWTAVADVDHYNIQIATDTGFSSIDTDQDNISQTEYTAGTLSADTYYWRVRAYGNNTLWSNWSSYYTLTIDSIPGTPSLTSPSNSSTTSDTTPTFTWSSVSDTDHYNIQIAKNTNFLTIDDTVVYGEDFESFSMAYWNTTSGVDNTDLAFSGTHSYRCTNGGRLRKNGIDETVLHLSFMFYMSSDSVDVNTNRVQICNAINNTDWGNTVRVTGTTDSNNKFYIGLTYTDTYSTTLALDRNRWYSIDFVVDVPNQLARLYVDQTLVSSLTSLAISNQIEDFELGCMNLNAANYTLYIDDFAYNNSTSFETFNYDNIGSTTYTPSALDLDTYYWRVRSYGNNTLWSNWSSYYTLTVDSIPDAPTLSTPTNGSSTTDTTPTFTWNSVVGADSYDIQIATDTSFSSLVEDTTGIGTTSFTASELSIDTYYWRVRTYGTNTLYSNWSSYYTLDVTEPAPGDPDIPLLLTPTDNYITNDTTPTFTWDNTGVVVIDYYNIQIATDTGFSSIVVNQSSIASENYTPSALPEDTYYWRVRAYANSTWSSFSNYFTLTIDSTDAPTLSTPTNNDRTSDDTPTFTWSSVVGANSYDIQVATDTGFSNLVVDETEVGTNSYTSTSLSDDTYYWRVRTYGTNTLYSSWTSYYTLIIDTVNPSSPTLLTPSDLSSTSDTTPTFTWSSVSNVSHYNIQIATDTGFSSLVKDQNSISTTSYTMTTLSEDTYYWRVRAYGENELWSDWSDYFTLTVAIPVDAPTLLTPANGALTDDYTPTFTWSSVADTSYYNFQIATDTGFSNVIINQNNINDTTYTSTTLTIDRYYWRVRAFGLNNIWSSWSDYFELNVVDVDPELILWGSYINPPSLHHRKSIRQRRE